MIDNDDLEVILPSKVNVISKAHEDDAFNVDYSELKTFKGLSKKLKKRATYRQNSMNNGYKGVGKAGSQSISEELISGYNFLDCIIPPFNIDYLTRLYEISPAHHAAINAKVESVYGLGWDWVESPKAKQMRERTRTESGRNKLESDISNMRQVMTDWLEDINNLDTWDEIMKKTGTDYEATGNGYIEIGRTPTGAIGYIGHIPAKHIRIRRERDGFCQIIGRDIRFFRNFGDRDTPNPITDDPTPNEIVHFKKYSPTSLYYGVPDIIAAKSALGGNEFASRYNLDYFENKAVPRHVIILRGASLKPAQSNKIVEFLEAGLRGQHHRSILIPLGMADDNGKMPEIEFKSIEEGKQDFSFGEYREANNEEIFMAHRTPLTRAGVFGKNLSLSASRDSDKVFKEGYSRPEQANFENKMARVFKEKTDFVVFKLNELSLVDEDTQSKIDERDVRMQVKVPNEVRRRKGLAQRPDGEGDKPWQASAQQSAEQKAQAGQTRTRDSERSASASNGNSNGTRNEAGAGRSSA